MPRKLVALAVAALSALALAAGANAATYSFVSPDEVQIETPNGMIIAGSLVNTAPQFGLPSGATVGRFTARLTFQSESLGSVYAVFAVPRSHFIASGTFNPAGGPPSFSVRSLGEKRSTGSLQVVDDGQGGPSQFVFELP